MYCLKGRGATTRPGYNLASAQVFNLRILNMQDNAEKRNIAEQDLLNQYSNQPEY